MDLPLVMTHDWPDISMFHHGLKNMLDKKECMEPDDMYMGKTQSLSKCQRVFNTHKMVMNTWQQQWQGIVMKQATTFLQNLGFYQNNTPMIRLTTAQCSEHVLS